MNNYLHRYEEIESYLQGSHENPVLFEKELLDNESLRQEVNIHRLLQESLKNKDKNQLRSTLLSVSKDFTEETQVIAPQTAVVRNIGDYQKYVLSIAAGLAAVFCGIWFLKPNTNNNTDLNITQVAEKTIEVQSPNISNEEINKENIASKERIENYTPPKGKQTLPDSPNELTAEAGQTKTEPVSASFNFENVDFEKTLQLDENGRVNLDFYAEIGDNQTSVEDFKLEVSAKSTENTGNIEPVFSKTISSEIKKPIGFASKKPLIHTFEMQTKATLKAGFYEIKVKNKAGKVVYSGNVEVKN
jgi:hypothetical protein